MNKKALLAIYSCLYAVIYTFCLYNNLYGITFPIFVIATLCYGALCFKEFDVKIKTYSLYIGFGALLIGVSQPLTDNNFIHITNVIVVFGLLILFFMNQFVEDDRWNFVHYFNGLMVTCVSAVSHMIAPFSDLSNHKKSDEKTNTFPWKTVLLTVISALPMLILVIILLSSADLFFSNLLEKLIQLDNVFTYIKITLLTLLVFLLSYGLIAFLIKKPFQNFYKDTGKWDATIAVTIGIMFDLVYLVFSFVQIFGLFMGNFELPEGTTYAEYAREGFFQLLLVCMLNLVFVIIGLVKFNDNILVKIVLTVTCICTYVMVASSAFRMILYIRYYYFTFYRILVLWTLTVIAFLMTEVVISIWKPGFNLFKAATVTALIFYLALAFSHTDYFVAKWNVSENTVNSEFFLAQNDYNDFSMLSRLSLDAAPILLDPENHIELEYTYFLQKVEKPEKDFRKFNISKFIAEKYYRRQ